MSCKITRILFLFYILIKSISDGLVFPASSTIGIFAAIAVPLDLTHRNVFVSYNFEANYNLPYLGSDIIPGPLQRFEDIGRNNAEGDENKNTFSNLKLFSSRAHLYDILNKFFKRFSNNTNDCLLHLICLLNNSNASRNNGVLGSILEVIFSPSSSEYESDGKSSSANHHQPTSCQDHNEKCGVDFLKTFLKNTI